MTYITRRISNQNNIQGSNGHSSHHNSNSKFVHNSAQNTVGKSNEVNKNGWNNDKTKSECSGHSTSASDHTSSGLSAHPFKNSRFGRFSSLTSIDRNSKTSIHNLGTSSSKSKDNISQQSSGQSSDCNQGSNGKQNNIKSTKNTDKNSNGFGFIHSFASRPVLSLLRLDLVWLGQNHG
jgi:hypothetical protein